MIKRYFTVVFIVVLISPISGLFCCKAEEAIKKVDVNTIITFWQKAGIGTYGTFAQTYEKAKTCFPVGEVIEGYPEKLKGVVGCVNDIRRTAHLVEKDGFNPDDMCGISLRAGSDGIISHDIVLVISKDIGKIAGVYHVGWGR